MRSGAIAGALATVPMTAIMEAAFRRLPPAERYPLPPRQIVDTLVDESGVPVPAEGRPRLWLTLIAHVGYGAVSGAVFGVRPPASAPRAVRAGALFGSALWVVSYVGWLPALRILRPITAHPARRTALMVGAHLAWGVTTGLVTYVASRAKRR